MARIFRVQTAGPSHAGAPRRSPPGRERLPSVAGQLAIVEDAAAPPAVRQRRQPEHKPGSPTPRRPPASTTRAQARLPDPAVRQRRQPEHKPASSTRLLPRRTPRRPTTPSLRPLPCCPQRHPALPSTTLPLRPPPCSKPTPCCRNGRGVGIEQGGGHEGREERAEPGNPHSQASRATAWRHDVGTARRGHDRAAPCGAQHRHGIITTPPQPSPAQPSTAPLPAPETHSTTTRTGTAPPRRSMVRVRRLAVPQPDRQSQPPGKPPRRMRHPIQPAPGTGDLRMQDT